MTTEQEAFWQGTFGDEYTRRTASDAQAVASHLALFSRALSHTHGIANVLELGANVGHNLAAIAQLIPGVDMTAIEINATAVHELKRRLPQVAVLRESIFDLEHRLWIGENGFDLVFTHGVLIHLAPEKLPDVYRIMHEASRKYILVSEYYSPQPTAIKYRGHEDKLFKRDFAGELLDSFPDLKLLAYGFGYHRDPNFPQDDTTWFLMEKKQ